MRQIVLDTETTGLDPDDGHRIIEIGCVELMNRRIGEGQYNQYLNPEREIDPGAAEVHGITLEQLSNKPRFADVASEFIAFVRDAELIIHNAPFDVGFIDSELARLKGKWGKLADYCTITDTLAMARRMHPGQKNTLDALCKRYEVDNSRRELHGALLDAQILADVYLAMTGGQESLLLDGSADAARRGAAAIQRLPSDRPPLRVIPANEEEMEAHVARLAAIDDASEGNCVWYSLEEDYP